MYFRSRPLRVQNVSRMFREFEAGLSSVEQPDRVFRCRRTQVHVTLRRRQVRVPQDCRHPWSIPATR